MRAPDLRTIASSLLQADTTVLPTVILVREVPLYEVDFAALSFDEEEKLPSIDWAALALARALGEISPADVDSYLGLGAPVSEGLVRRLLDENLVEQRAATAHSHESANEGFFERLFRTKQPVEGLVPPPGPLWTAAQKLHESRARKVPVCRLSSAGAQALDQGKVTRHRVRPARLLFVADPLLFVGVIDEKKHRHTQHRRPSLLEPDRVPQALRTLDATFALRPQERLVACGIADSLRGFSGQFAGLMPGTQWEVRRTERRTGNGREQEVALLVCAAYLSADSRGVQWRVHLRRQERTLDCSHLEAARLLDQQFLSLPALLASLSAEVQVPSADALREDGAFEIRCGEMLPELLGESDRPDDTFLPAATRGWSIGLRTHAMPEDAAAARNAFFEFLRRREAALRRDFDQTCASTAASLIGYWGDGVELPSADSAASALWPRAELRAALCMRRRHRDLVASYELTEPTEAAR